MSDGITDYIADNRSAVQNSSVAIASLGLEASGRAVFGSCVQPAVWIMDPNSSPDALDVALFAVGLAGRMLGIATALTGVVKGLVDDDTRRRLEQVQAAEPARYRDFLLPCSGYSVLAGGGINAQSIASKGGTAWRHPNNLWIYIVDARRRPVCDYAPQTAVEIYQPHLPLRPSGDGFRWHRVRG